MKSSLIPKRFADILTSYVKESYLPRRQRAHRLKPFRGEDVEQFSHLIQELHLDFTSNRNLNLGQYFRSPKVRAAYLLGYLPMNLAKMLALWNEAGELPISSRRPIRVLDFGAGPLTATLSLLISKPELEFEIIAFDQNLEIMKDGLEIAKRFSQNLPRVRLTTQSPQGMFDLIIVSNLLNELQTPKVLTRTVFSKVEKDGVLVLMEPATREFSKILMNIREEMVGNTDWSILYPCRHSGACPLLAHPQYGWCHQVSPTALPSIFSQIRQKARLLPHEAKRSSLILTRQKFSSHPSSSRILSHPMASPKGMVVYLCQPKKPEERPISSKQVAFPGSLFSIS